MKKLIGLALELPPSLSVFASRQTPLASLGTMSSSRRFKNEIKPMDEASDAVLALKPVMFSYKSDKTNTPQFGLIAEEVAALNPDLVVRDEKARSTPCATTQRMRCRSMSFSKSTRKCTS